MIDRGTADGVQPDMAVIGAKGVVGRVINQPTPHAAQVQLLIGKLAGAGVTIERSGAGIALERTGTGGIAVGGAGDPPLRLEYVPNSADLRVGDRVLTSGQDGIYPPGFLVGTVGVPNAAQSTGVAVRPAVDFTHIDIVLVVLAKPGP
jgi:rod shape-determining protein MreC